MQEKSAPNPSIHKPGTPSPENCPDPSVHGAPFRYCPYCTWMEPQEPVERIEDVRAGRDLLAAEVKRLTEERLAYYEAAKTLRGAVRIALDEWHTFTDHLDDAHAVHDVLDNAYQDSAGMGL